MIAALTWAAAQDRIPVHELIRGLTPTDELRIEAAYAEWRRRAAAGEKRPKVDWHSYPVPDISPVAAPAAQSVTAVSIPVDHTEDDEQDEDNAADADPDVVDAVEQILAVEAEEPEYISLDDFNLEPSEAEMREMDALIRKEEAVTNPAPAEEAVVEAEAASDPVAEAVSIKQRISQLPKNATPDLYAALLSALGGDIEMAKMVTEAVIKDHTKRHRGTAPQRAFLNWLKEINPR